MSEFWNQKYQRSDYFYGEQPNEFLTSQIYRLPENARILVVGDGEGRNGVWLAHRGYDVTTVDFSESGCEKSRQLAERHGVDLDVQCANLLEWDWPKETYDAVVSIFLHFTPEQRPVVHRHIERSLVDDGLLIIELFHPRQLHFNSGGPKDEAMLMTAEMLEHDFPALDWLILAEGKVLLDEGPGHRGPGYVTHGVGRRHGR